MRLPLTAVLAAMLAVPAGTARASDTQIWPTTTVSVALGKGFRISNETVVRIGDARGLYELENSTMVGRKVNSNVTLSIGYTHDPNYLRGDFQIMEHRIRQEVDFEKLVTIGKIRIGGRLRLEERWRDGASGTALRLRPQIRLTAPLIEAARIGFIASHESFLDLNTAAFQPVRGEERMRNFAGIGVPLSERVRIEAGYLNQHGFPKNRASTTDHVLVIGLIGNF